MRSESGSVGRVLGKVDGGCDTSIGSGSDE
jgi:hypothetical protein